MIGPRAAVRALVLVLLAVGILTFATVPPASAGGIRNAKVAIAAGRGAEAARIIRHNDYNLRPRVLAEIIYGAGVIAVKNDTDDVFPQAVARAFVRGEVSFATAQKAFFHGGGLVARNAPARRAAARGARARRRRGPADRARLCPTCGSGVAPSYLFEMKVFTKIVESP